jgi:hypothetical protein
VSLDTSPSTPTDEEMRVFVAAYRRRQRAALRQILVNFGLTAAQRDLLLNQYFRGVRRVIRHIARGDDLAARAALANLELFLQRAKEYPHELVCGVDLALCLEPARQQISKRISIACTDMDVVDALRGLAGPANLFAQMRGAAERDEVCNAEKIKPAVEGNLKKGKETRDLARDEAQKLLQKNHRLSREGLVRLIAPKMQISEHHARKLLTGLNRPESLQLKSGHIDRDDPAAGDVGG